VKTLSLTVTKIFPKITPWHHLFGKISFSCQSGCGLHDLAASIKSRIVRALFLCCRSSAILILSDRPPPIPVALTSSVPEPANDSPPVKVILGRLSLSVSRPLLQTHNFCDCESSITISRLQQHSIPMKPLSSLRDFLSHPFDRAAKPPSRTLKNALTSKGLPSGRIKFPADPEDAHLYNLRIPLVPAVIISPRSAEEVAVAVKVAKEAGLKVQAKSGGHNFANYGSGGISGQMVIDLKHLQKFQMDHKTWRATIGAGTLLGDVTQKLHDNGKRAIPHGVCPQVGIGGNFFVASDLRIGELTTISCAL
jgi:hypothetical protein